MELTDQIAKLVQIIIVDLVLAGDNAIVIGLVAAQFNKEFRRKVILYGVGVAVVLRIVFALLTVQLLAIKGLLIAGGLLLLWVCWKLWVDLRQPHLVPSPDSDADTPEGHKNPPLRTAIFQIAMADLSMSLDNVLAVAGIAEGHSYILVFGLVLSIVLMAVAASVISETLQKHRWIGYVGLAIIFYVAIKMLLDGYHQLFPGAI